MNSKDRIALTLAIGIITIVGIIVVGEVLISHKHGNEISDDVISLIKIGVTGLISILSYYMGQRSATKDKEK